MAPSRPVLQAEADREKALPRRRLSLRIRLVATLVVLAMAGLVVSGLVINNQFEKYLITRADQRLVAAFGLVGQMLYGREGGSRPPPPSAGLPAGTYGAVFSATNGQLLKEVQPSFSSGQDSGAELQYSTTVYARPDITSSQIQLAAASGTQSLTVSGTGDVSSFRVLLQPRGTDIIAVAIPQSDIDATLTQLLWLEIAVGVGVLIVLGAFTYVIVRSELRPLEKMSETAAAIAGGELSHRVDEASGGTEVGQLGSALNIMLERIEEAFAARKASEDRLRRFVGDASHELRTPLTSIRGYAEMFRRGASAEPADLETVMRRIEQESERMSGLVDDLLLLARLDQQRPLRSEPVDLRQLLVDVSLDSQAAHPSHPLTVAADETVTVEGDGDALRQVVVNLARNACVHTPDGTAVEMFLSRAGDSAQVVVDHGPGVPPELGDEVFERFTRADASRGRDAGGTGLGLSIVSAIIAAHGGTVNQSSTPGGGATFRFTVPLVATNAPVRDPIWSDAQPPAL